MILAIDVGNTNIVLGCIEDNDVKLVLRMATEQIYTDDQYAMQISSILALSNIDVHSLEHCIISSVVPPITNTLKRSAKKLIGKEPMVIGPGLKTGLNIKIDNPAQLGSDLVVDAVATINEYSLPAIVIDMGTATTVSVIAKDASYLGGMIMPGVGLSVRTLAKGTSQLPSVSVETPDNLIGKNTVDCMKSGIVYGNACAIDGLIDRITEELGEKPTIVATGGLAQAIVPLCKHDIIYDNTLLLKGLNIIYNKNKK